MTPFVREFVKEAVSRFKLGGKVLEVGSLDVNGQVRDIFEGGAEDDTYLGVDFRDGPGVDRVVNALDLVPEFSEWSFDVVVCCDTLEHIDRFWVALKEMKDILRPSGYLLLTVPDFEVVEHRHPSDYWRFGPDSVAVLMNELEPVYQIHIGDSALTGGWGMVGRKPS